MFFDPRNSKIALKPTGIKQLTNLIKIYFAVCICGKRRGTIAE